MKNICNLFLVVLDSKVPIKSINDKKLQILRDTKKHLSDWRQWAKKKAKQLGLTKKQGNKLFLAYQTDYTLRQIINGFLLYIEDFFKYNKSSDGYFVITSYESKLFRIGF